MLSHPERRSYEGVTLTRMAQAKAITTYSKGSQSSLPEETRVILDHIQNNICKGDEDLCEYVINWMVDAIQNPGRRPCGACD